MKYLIVPVVLFILFPFEGYSRREKKADKNEVVDVFTAVVKKEEIFDPVLFAGFLEARKSMAAYSGVTGIVQDLPVTEGQIVQKGTVVAEILPQGAGLEYRSHKVRAPISGVVSRINQKVGELAQTNSVVAKIADLREFVTTVQVTYSDLFQIKKGDEVTAIVASGTSYEKNIPAKVLSVAPLADSKLGTYAVVVMPLCGNTSNCKNLLRLGALVKVLFKQNRREGLRIDVSNLRNRQKSVLVMTDEGKAKWVDVKVGKNFGAKVEILEGLKEGMNIVTSFSKYPVEGQKLVRVSKKEAIANGLNKKKIINPAKSKKAQKKPSKVKKAS